MTISPTQPPMNLFLPPAVAAPSSALQPLLSLRPDQVVQATVIAGGMDTPILLLGNERLQVVSNRPLQIGQILDLRILQTAPRIEALVVNDVLRERLAARLPLLSRPFHWGQLLERLEQPRMAQELRPVDIQLVQRLQQLLDPAGGEPASLKQRIDLLALQLRPADPPPALPQTQIPYSRFFPPLPGATSSGTATAEELRSANRLLSALQSQLALLPDPSGRRPSRDWQNATADLLSRIPRHSDFSFLAAPRSPEWLEALDRLHRHPQVAAHVAAEAERILGRIQRTLAVSPPLAQQEETANLTGATKEGTVASFEQKQVIASLRQLAHDLKALAGAADQGLATGSKPLPPGLLGRIEGLAQRLSRLLAEDGALPILQQLIRGVTVQLQQLAALPATPARGEDLGLLAQLFGLHLERELLLGKQKSALANLKQSLSALQRKLGEDFKEPLGRIELFQLCKARLAEIQMQFLPLPFSELEEGYLLAGRRESGDTDSQERSEADEPLQVSLSLRLSALGNMRVDLQFDPHQGMMVQLACEDRRKMEYLQACGDELAAALTTVTLKGIHYTADALHPVRQLQQRLLPEQRSLLDTRG